VLGTGSELVVLVLKQDVERGERSVTARDILLQVELVRIAQFVARVHFLLEHSQIIPNHDDFVEECLKRNFFRLKRTVSRLHEQGSPLPSSSQTFYEHVLLFQPERFDHRVSSIADQIRKRHLQLAQSSGGFRRLEIAGGRRNCPLRVVKLYLGGFVVQRSHCPDAVLRMAHLHTDMERFDFHVAQEVCEIVSESATIVAILESVLRKRSFRRVAETNTRAACAPRSSRSFKRRERQSPGLPRE